MKTLAITKKVCNLGLFMVLFIASVAFNQVQAQQDAKERIVKGVVSTAEGPLEGAGVLLKGTAIGTTTNDKGEFTFPQPLKTGDVLLVSYLGYQTANYTIEDGTTFVRLMLAEDVIDFVGAPNSDKPYKSKRSKE